MSTVKCRLYFQTIFILALNLTQSTFTMVSSTCYEGTPLIHLKRNRTFYDIWKSNEPTGSPSRSSSSHSLVDLGITLAWKELSVYSKTKGKQLPKTIINKGVLKSGSFVALIGSSGAGKSTLLSTLAYRNSGCGKIDGEILVNGYPIDNFMRHISGFMYQDDIFLGSLTVMEHMNIMARLKLDRRIEKKGRIEKISELLKQVGLSKCIHTKIDDSDKVLSGGEKKRLAFATELLTDPMLLFCDEPTTGLDSYSAEKLITMMKTMVLSGKTIICTIHQPSFNLFTMFNQLILLADGRIAYMGSISNAQNFFDSLGYFCPRTYNPADFFVKILAIIPGSENRTKRRAKRICDCFVTSHYIEEIDNIMENEFKTRSKHNLEFTARKHFKGLFWWSKLYWLIYRWFLNILRNPSTEILRIFQRTVVAILIGLCYIGTTTLTQKGVQSIQGVLFLLITENTFTPMYSALVVFPQNAPLFHREYDSGLYSSSLYYLSKLLAMLPGLLIESIIFVIIVYWLSGLRSTFYAFLITTIAIILTMNISAACGVFFSNALGSVPIAMAYLVPFDYLLMVTSGLFINLSTLPGLLTWTKYLSWLMYSMETMTILQWENVSNITCETTDNELPCIVNGHQVIEKYNFSEDNIYRNIWIMCIIYFIFHILGFLCLWWRVTKKK